MVMEEDYKEPSIGIIAPSNRGKISNRLMKEFRKRNINCHIIVPSQQKILLVYKKEKKKINRFSVENPFSFKIALVRGVGSKIPSKIFYRLDWMRTLELFGIRLFNSRESLELSTNKALTSHLLIKNGIKTPATIICENHEQALSGFEILNKDVLIKPIYGARGKGIFRIRNQETARKIFIEMEKNNEIIYLQEYLEHNNEDIRLLVVFGEVIAAMKRKGENWLTNLSQGGIAIPYNPTLEEKEVAIKAAKSVKGDIVGVDLMHTNKGLMVIEVNAVPGYLGLQKVSKINITKIIVDKIIEKNRDLIYYNN